MLDAFGRLPHGYTVMNPSPSGDVTVTFIDTAPTPVAGTPLVPATLMRSGVRGRTSREIRPIGLREMNARELDREAMDRV